MTAIARIAWFLSGFATSVGPSLFLPILGTALLIRSRIAPRQSHVALLSIGSFLATMPLALTVDLTEFLQSLLYFLLIAATFLGVVSFKRSVLNEQSRAFFVVGIIAAQALILILCHEQVYGNLTVLVQQTSGYLPTLNTAAIESHLNPLRWPGRAWLWWSHPNILAASNALTGFLALTLASPSAPGLGLTSIFLAFAVIAYAGSRTALIALLVSLLVLSLTALFRSKIRKLVFRRVNLAKYAIAFIGMSGLLPILGISRVSSLLDPRFYSVTSSPVNLIQSSEDLGDSVVWKRKSAHVREGSVTGWSIAKDVGVGGEARVQQSVRLEGASTYILTGQVQILEPGVLPTIELSSSQIGYIRVDKNPDEWIVHSEGNLQVVSFSQQNLTDGWISLHLEFLFAMPSDMSISLALIPNRQVNHSSSITVRDLMLSKADEYEGYIPTYPQDRVVMGSRRAFLARFDAFREAFRLFEKRPFFGWGSGPLSDLVEIEGSSERHAHNLILQSLWQTGIVGLVGLVIFFSPIVAISQGAHAIRAAFLTLVILLNTFDMTLFAGGVPYTVAAIGGALIAFSNRSSPEMQPGRENK